MNVKRVFGTLLSLLGLVGLIYGAFLFINTSGGAHNIKMTITCIVLGLVFFSAGMGLMRTMKDDAAG